MNGNITTTRKCKCGHPDCNNSIDEFQRKRIIHPDCRSWYNKQLAKKRNINKEIEAMQTKQQNKLTIQKAAFEFLYVNKAFQDCMQGWIDFAIEHGAVKINIAWVAWSVRQFGHLQFKNAYVPYFKKWICKNWPEYAKYFKGNK